MSNLFRFIATLALALAAADYLFSVFAALIDLFPSLPTLPSSYIYISSLLVVCAYKLFSALPKLLNDDLSGLFFTVFAEKISSRIISWIIDHFPCFNSNGDKMNGGKLNNSQSSDGQINGNQGDTGHSSGGQMNGVQMNGGAMNNGKLNCIQISGGQSSRVQLNGVQMNGGQMTNGQLNIKQSKVAKANMKYNN